MKAVIIYDDVALAAGQKIEADGTTTLVINGQEYELDLAKKTREKFDEMMAPWLAVAHRVTGKSQRSGGQVAGSSAAHIERLRYLKGFRQWAERQDPPVSYRTPSGSYFYKQEDLRAYEAALAVGT